MANFRTLVQELAKECGASAPSSVTNQKGESKRFVEWVNRANQDLEGLWANWKFLWAKDNFDTVADTRTYTPAADIGEWDPDSFKVDNTPLSLVQHELAGDFDLDETGQPHTAVVMPNNSLRLFPMPDAAYNITFEYYRAPKAMADNDDLPRLPAKFHDIVVLRALIKYAYYESAPEVLDRARDEYPSRLMALESSQLPGNSGIHNFSRSNIQVTVE